jgi:hypothetical protein
MLNRGHRYPGKLDGSALGLTELLPVRLSGGREGDWRNWQATDEWAAGIAGELYATPQ